MVLEDLSNNFLYFFFLQFLQRKCPTALIPFLCLHSNFFLKHSTFHFQTPETTSLWSCDTAVQLQALVKTGVKQLQETVFFMFFILLMLTIQNHGLWLCALESKPLNLCTAFPFKEWEYLQLYFKSSQKSRTFKNASQNHRTVEVGSDLQRSTSLVSKQGNQKVAQDCVLLGSEHLYKLLDKLVQCLTIYTLKKILSHVEVGLSVFQFWLLPLTLSLGTTGKSLAPPSLLPLLGIFTHG